MDGFQIKVYYIFVLMVLILPIHTQSEDLCYCDIDYKNNPSITKKQINELLIHSPFGRNFILMGDLNNTFACNVLGIKNNCDYIYR